MQETKQAREPSTGWRRPPWLVRGLRGIELIELTAGAVLVTAMVVLVMMQVVSRVTPLQNYVWTGELARFCLLWLAFGLSGYLLGRDEHIALDVADHVLPSLGQRLVRVFSLLVVAGTAVMFGYEGLDLFASGSPIRSPATGIPQGWIYFIPLVGMALTVLRAVVVIVFPARAEGQIRVAGEVIAGETARGEATNADTSRNGDAMTRSSLDEATSTRGSGGQG